MSYENLEVVVRDGVTWIRIARETRGNSLSSDTYEELRAATRLAEADDEVDVIVFTGTGRFFATGGDLDEAMVYIDNRDVLQLHRFFDITPFDAIQDSEKVTVAAVNGICMAGGLMLAKSCDICLAADTVKFAIPEGRVGLADPWIPSFFKACANPSLARYLMFSGKQFPATTAKELGIVGEIVERDQLTERVREMIDDVRESSVWARRRYKRFISSHRDVFSKESLARMYLEDDVVERLRAAWADRPKAR